MGQKGGPCAKARCRGRSLTAGMTAADYQDIKGPLFTHDLSRGTGADFEPGM